MVSVSEMININKLTSYYWLAKVQTLCTAKFNEREKMGGGEVMSSK